MDGAVALTGTVSEVVAVPAGQFFALVCDIDRLPEWNAILQAVLERPPAMTPDAEWVVELRAMGNRWRSRSRVLELDDAGRRLVYRSETDDGNPSYAVWSWGVDGDGASSRVTVRWELHPKTFWRRVLLSRVRNRQLRNEVRASIHAAAQAAVGGAP
jgi:polyketide cyclase/dehydrase/lipid transport protein